MQWEQLKLIKQEFKDIAYGYIRLNIQPLFAENMDNSYYIIPELVYSLCLLCWYQAMDKFDTNLLSEIVEISNENKTISINSAHKKGSSHRFTAPSKYCICYGSMIIRSKLNASYIWKFKNLSPIRFPMMHIGIADATKKCIDETVSRKDGFYTLFPTGNGISTGFDCCDYNRIHTKYRDNGSILTMRLTFDGDKGKLFYKNEKEDSTEQLVFDKIERSDDLEYRMVVSMGNLQHSIELLQFEQLL